MSTATIRPTYYTNGFSQNSFIVAQFSNAVDGDETTSMSLGMLDVLKESYDIDFTTWDCSGIPAGSTVNSVDVYFVGYTNSNARFVTTGIEARAGTTIRGTAEVDDINDSKTNTLTGQQFTLAELQEGFNVRFYTTHDSRLAGYYYLQEIYAVVDYTAPAAVGTGFYVKTSGAWAEASALYKKIDGAWVQQTDVAAVFNATAKYRRMTS